MSKQNDAKHAYSSIERIIYSGVAGGGAVVAVAPRSGQRQNYCCVSDSYYITITFFLSTRNCAWPGICRKCICSRGFAPDPTGGAHNAPPDPLVSWGGDTPPQTPPQSAQALRPSRLQVSRSAPLHIISGCTPLII